RSWWTVTSRPNLGLITPAKDGQPTPSPATGKTWAGRPKRSDTFAELLRRVLIGHVPRPTRSAAATKVASTIAASTDALKNGSRWSLTKGRPRQSKASRWRRLLPQNTRIAG